MVNLKKKKIEIGWVLVKLMEVVEIRGDGDGVWGGRQSWTPTMRFPELGERW